MSRAILVFRLPQENWEHESAIHGSSYRVALHNLKEHVFHQFDEGEHSKDVKKVYEEILDIINSEISDLPPL